MNKPDILVYCNHIHPGLRYVLDWIIGDCWKKTYLLTTDQNVALGWSGPRLAYTQDEPPFQPWIVADSTGFNQHNTLSSEDVVWAGDQPWLFYQPGVQASLPADILAASFWFLSRLEEYGPFDPDAHGRFAASESLAYTNQFLRRPVVDEWVGLLHDVLAREFGDWKVQPYSFTVQSTFDIDYAWRYLNKPLFDQIKTLSRDFLMEGPSVFWRGLCTTFGWQSDPYDLYASWKSMDPVLFFPLADKSHFDRNHSWKQKAYQSLIQSSAKDTHIGIHPGYDSMNDPDVLARDIHRFEIITGESPIRSRQHYLRFNLPGTYRMLEDQGIREDWSMGYADQPGFRAGTSRSFLWFDLQANRTSQLRIFPFQVMDTTLLHYLKLTPAEGKAVVDELVSTLKKTNGQLTTLAHNNSMAGVDRIWRGWQNIWPKHER